jgi:hypothetical protein
MLRKIYNDIKYLFSLTYDPALSGIRPHRRLARARAVWKADDIGGPDTVERMLIGGDLAEIDPYRATTHNKGIMNGVSAVVCRTSTTLSARDNHLGRISGR